jgi:succinyl-CoA synthetase alpha subunit
MIVVCVESNGYLAVKPKTTKLTYAETVRINTTVDVQDRLIGIGGDPTNGQVNVDIKKK